MMFQEINLGGVYVAPFAELCCFALLVFVACRFVLARTGVLRRLWHPALFEVGLYTVILATLSGIFE